MGCSMIFSMSAFAEAHVDPRRQYRARLFQSKRVMPCLRPEGLRDALPRVFWGWSRLEGVVDFDEGPFLKKCPLRSFLRFYRKGKREL